MAMERPWTWLLCTLEAGCSFVYSTRASALRQTVCMGPPNCYHSRRSTSPLAARRMIMEREGQLFAPKQQLQQPRPVRDQQKQMRENQLAGQAIAVKQQELSEAAVPKDLRLPQPPNRRTVPDWVEDCFGKDEYALLTEEQCNISFLREGVVPKVGMMLYLQMTYKHDGSHPQHYRTWGRMVGEITHVYDPPEVGVYAVYDGQEVRLSPQELQQERNNLPALPPSLFGQNATCECCRTAEQVVEQYGAVHGQRVKGKMWLMRCDSGLEPQLGGFWDIELVANDNLDSMWVLCAMSRQDDEQPQEQLPRQRQHQEQQQAKQAQQQQGKQQPQQQAQHQQQHAQQQAQQQVKQTQQQCAQQQAQQQAQQSPQSRDTRGDEGAPDQQGKLQSAQPGPTRAQEQQQEEGQVQGNDPPAGRSAQQQQPALSDRRKQPQEQQQDEPCPHSARRAEPKVQQQQLHAGSDRHYDRAQQQEQNIASERHYDRAHSATRQQQPQNGRKQQDWEHKQQGHHNQQQHRNRDYGREQRVFDQRRDCAREQQRKCHDREQRREHTNPEQQRQGHGREQQTHKRQQQHDLDRQQQRECKQQRGYERERDGSYVRDHGYQGSDRSWYGREQDRDWDHKQAGDWDHRERKRSTSSGSGRNSY